MGGAAADAAVHAYDVADDAPAQKLAVPSCWSMPPWRRTKATTRSTPRKAALEPCTTNPTSTVVQPASAAAVAACEAVAAATRRNVVGSGAAFGTPFGARRMAYADWAASGRALAPVEDFIRRCARRGVRRPHAQAAVRARARRACSPACL